MAAPEILLTEEQRSEFTQIPHNISEEEISRYFTFSKIDIAFINRHRRDYNKLGFAVQLYYLRNPGRTLVNTGDIPNSVLSYIAEQLQNRKEFEQYALRRNTMSKHLQELGEEYGFRNFNNSDYIFLVKYLMPSALENYNVLRLICRCKININNY